MILPLLIYVTLQQQTAQISKGVWGPKDVEKNGNTKLTHNLSAPFGAFPSSCPFIKTLFVSVLKNTNIHLALRLTELQQE